MQEQGLIPHLFRTEYSKIIAVLCKAFGMEYIALAEDIASDTFLQAAETWGMKGLPANPVAWLYAVAKNKAIDAIKRNALFTKKIAPELIQSTEINCEPEIDLSGQNIIDSQLQMMFAICHPSIPAEAQVGLCLNLLCGFGADEVADAFLTNRETIYKRLARAKEKLKSEHIILCLPAASEINNRLARVLTALYLLFSEGYYSSSQNATVRKELCVEAMRLTHMLVDNEQTSTPQSNALLALMCFHSSRFEARINEEGDQILYHEQDERLWNTELISHGEFYMCQASKGNEVSKFHLEAAIAFWHTQKTDTPEKWDNILQLYNRLLITEYSPAAALNRTYALAKANGIQEAIKEAELLKLDGNHLYHALLGDLYSNIDHAKAITHLTKAAGLAKNAAEKNLILKKAAAINTGNPSKAQEYLIKS